MLIPLTVLTYNTFASNIQNVPDYARRTYLLHTVRWGESLNRIAHRYGITTLELAEANNISTRTKLYTGVKLKIPVNPNDKNFAYNTNTIAANDNDDADTDSGNDSGGYVSPYLSLNKDVNDESSDNDSSENVASEETATGNTVEAPNGLVPVNYTVKKNDSLLGIADLFSARVSDLRNWNNIPYTTTIRVGQTLTIYVPEDKKEFYASLDNQSPIEKTTSQNIQKNSDSWVYHRIRRGETLSSIASRYRVDIGSLREWNDLSSNKIYAGRKLKIYTDKSLSYYADEDASSTHTSLYHYKIKRGDTISELAEKFGVAPVFIRKWNNMSNNRLIAGKTLKIFTNRSTSLGDNTTKTSANVIYHKIQLGETIGEIAEMYRVSTASIRRWNRLSSNRIIAGKTLKIYSDSDVYDLHDKKSSNENHGKTYIVRTGDSLYSIARLNNLSIKKLKSINSLSSNKIIVGQVLRLD